VSGGASRSTFAPFDAVLLGTLAGMWGFSFLFIKVAVGVFSPVWVVSLRTVVGALALLVILRFRGRSLPRDRAVWGHLFVLALFSNALPWGAVAWAVQFLPSGLSSVLNALVPVSTLAVAVAIGQETLSSRRIVGLVLATVGTAIAVSGELGAPGKLVAVLVVVLATIFYAAGAVYAKHHVSGRLAPLTVATGQVIAAAIVTLPVAALTSGLPALDAVDPGEYAALGALGLFGTGLAFLVFYSLIERVGATSATMVTYLIPVVGLLAGWAVLGEHIGPEVLAGTAVLIVGIWLAQRHRRTDPIEAMEEVRA
jgi:drug/metabolite transporter (DMT)-like permease